MEVLYRDVNLIAVNKPSGMAVHRGLANDPVTVADILRDEIVGSQVFAAHRLDRATSGVLIFALNSETARFIQNQIENASFKKYYLALVRGPMNLPFTLDHPVPKGPGEERVNAVTAFRPLEHVDRWTLVEAIPITGRYHQIRRHLKHLSHHIVGDVRYGKGEINRFFREHHKLARLALHAARLEFTLPNKQALTLNAQIPSDLKDPLSSMGFSQEFIAFKSSAL